MTTTKTQNDMKTMNNTYRSELEIKSNGFFLTIEATLTPEDENILTAEGWRLLNNGVTLDCDNTPALYFFKPFNA